MPGTKNEQRRVTIQSGQTKEGKKQVVPLACVRGPGDRARSSSVTIGSENLKDLSRRASPQIPRQSFRIGGIEFEIFKSPSIFQVFFRMFPETRDLSKFVEKTREKRTIFLLIAIDLILVFLLRLNYRIKIWIR